MRWNDEGLQRKLQKRAEEEFTAETRRARRNEGRSNGSATLTTRRRPYSTKTERPTLPQGLAQIFDQVGGIFEADGDADGAGFD
jgi:hypothetical protein